MRGVAGSIEPDGARIGQGLDEMVGGVVAVKTALGAVDHQGRVGDPDQQGANVLPDQRSP
jgi:hypothetical protein